MFEEREKGMVNILGRGGGGIYHCTKVLAHGRRQRGVVAESCRAQKVDPYKLRQYTSSPLQKRPPTPFPYPALCLDLAFHWPGGSSHRSFRRFVGYRGQAP
jgi:hypothetical protein